MPVSRLLISAILISALSACGGSGSSSSSPRANSKSYKELGMEFVDIQQEYFPSGTSENMTQIARMPTNGTATYDGVGAVLVGASPLDLAYGSPDTAPLVGDAKVTANFGNNKITGSVDKFKAGPGDRTTGGNLRLSGNIDGNTLTADLKGDVNLNGKTHGINLNAGGEFYGRNADAVAIGAYGRTSRGVDTTISILAEDD